VTAEVLALYARARWLLFRRGLKGALVRLRAPTARTAGDLDVHDLAAAATRALRLLPTDARDLVPSLVLSGLLARRGIDSTFAIGIDPGPDLSAHAWVEHAGAPLLAAGELHRFMEL